MSKIINVIKKNELNVLFDMVSDGLPEEGQYHLVPVGQEHIFIEEQRNKKLNQLINDSFGHMESTNKIVNEILNKLEKGI